MLDDPSEDGGARFRKASDHMDAELAAVTKEAEELDKAGKLDAAAIARMDARLKVATDAFDKALADWKAELEVRVRPPRPRWMLTRRYVLPVLALLAFAIVGTWLETTLGRTFIFAGSKVHRDVAMWIVVALVPLIVLGWATLESANGVPISTWMPRCFLVLLAAIPLVIALVIPAPLGWAALLGKLAGTQASNIEARVLTVEGYGAGDCKLSAELELQGDTVFVCVDRALKGGKLMHGDVALVSGRRSFAGMFVDEIRSRAVR